MQTTYDLRLVNSSSMIVAGPTQAGKTTFVHELLNLRHLIFKEPITSIYWVCNEYPKYDVRRDVEYIVGLPTDGFDFVRRNSIVVIDDLMMEAKDSSAITNLFTKVTHHLNCFVIYITQNYFTSTCEDVTRRRNVQYVVLFKNPADVSQIRTIGQKMFPTEPRFLTSTYTNAVSRPHGYLLLDLRQETPDILRVRSNILLHQFPMMAYKQKTV
jgi:hypothetical protein